MKIFTFILLLIFSKSIFAQGKLITYKKKTDEFINQRFEQSLIKNIEMLVTPMDSNKPTFLNFDLNKGKIVNFETASFFYEFYSAVLNYSFWFTIKIGKDKKIISDSSIFIDIPECIMKNITCGFITKDSAFKIAIKDSILHPNNLKASLINERKLKIFYWLITGSAKTIEGIISGVGRRRVIDTTTGLIVSR